MKIYLAVVRDEISQITQRAFAKRENAVEFLYTFPILGTRVNP